MAIAEAGSGIYDPGITQGSVAIGPITPAIQPYYIAVMVEDPGLAVVSSVAGTEGFAAANGAVYSSISTVTFTTVTISFFTCVPGSTTQGTITATYSEDAARSVAHISTWPEGATSSIVPSAIVTEGSITENVGVTHGGMDDDINNMLLHYWVHAQDVVASFGSDANYTDFASSSGPGATFGSGGATWAAQYIVGGGDLTATNTWTGAANHAQLIVEVAAAAAAASGLSIPIAMRHYLNMMEQ